MFSEYASRFLAQSQSRLSNFGNNDNDGTRTGEWGFSRPTRRPRDQPSRNTAGHRSILGRGYGGNPYQQNGSGSRFGGFASRIYPSQGDAPLFHSTLDEFREEDDEQERDREVADLAALQKSRRQAAASRLAESTGSEGSRGSLDRSMDDSDHPDHPYGDRGFGRGIKSSWNGTRSVHHQPRAAADGTRIAEDNEIPLDQDSNRGGRLVEIGLDSQEDGDDEPPESLLGEGDEEAPPTDSSPPAFQKFKSQAEQHQTRQQLQQQQQQPFLYRTETNDTDMESTQQTEPNSQQLLQTASPIIEGEIFRHDPFFAWIFLIAFAGMISTFVLVWLHTSTSRSPVGDTIYMTLQKSFNMLAIDTVVSIFVSLIWLAALRSFARPLVSVILIAVPIIMFSFSLYAFTSSFKGGRSSARFQDTVMRWASLVPAAGCLLWTWLVVKGRKAIDQAIEILQFSSKILAQNPGLLLVGFGCLALIVAWTWVWMAMFTRVFMGGYFSKSLARFVIQMSSWWLGAAFIFMYLWTLSVINAVHRATTAATVSQWYFHRNSGPQTPSNEIVAAALNHGVTTIFGTICESTLLSLLVRAPLIILPRRIGGMLVNLVSFWIPTSIVALTNPTTVTYAAIQSQNLNVSARAVTQLEAVSPGVPTNMLTPQTLRLRGGPNGRIPYRLAKLLLVATRVIMATALGFAGWVITARQLSIELPDGLGVRGSAYAYIVGIMASFIGYSVIGAVEGILSGIVDAVLICYSCERRMERGHGRFCLEAAYLFGER